MDDPICQTDDSSPHNAYRQTWIQDCVSCFDVGLQVGTGSGAVLKEEDEDHTFYRDPDPSCDFGLRTIGYAAKVALQDLGRR